MDVKRMHEMLEKLTECTKEEFEKGTENIDVAEMGAAVDMIKDISEAMYYRVLTNAMLDSDTDEIMEMFDRYGEDRRYYDHYRYKNGRFAPKGHGAYRRGYEEPPYYHMTPEMYREHDPEWYRDMDRKTGKMYYTEPRNAENMGISDRSHTRDSREGKSGMSRRTYMETKEMHKDNTPESKQAKMKDLEKYMGELSSDVTEMIADASPEERQLLKQKLQVLTQKIN